MDIAKTIEPFCNFSLTYWQKEYAQKLYDAEMEGIILYIVFRHVALQDILPRLYTPWLF